MIYGGNYEKNYHTHTARCMHAKDSDEDYVISAIKGGIQELGFSDHSPWDYASDYVSSIRMKLSEFDEYYESVSYLKEKYKDQISIKIGLECEYFPKYMSWLTSFIKEKKIDYIILGMHFDKTDEDGVYYAKVGNDNNHVDQYIEHCKEGIKTGLFSYVAHPDLFMRARDNFDERVAIKSRELCEFCKEYNMPVEYNLEGILVNVTKNINGYPDPDFWEIACEVGNEVIIGYDAHAANSLERVDIYDDAIIYLTNLGI